MKLSGDPNIFSVKDFISQWNLTQDLNTMEAFFLFVFICHLFGVHSFQLELDEIASLLHWGRFSYIDQIRHLSSSQADENLPGERDHHARN